jgi:orotate phosphoribosyltransferase-like protein
VSILGPPSYQAEAIYASPEFALELQKSGMTREQIANELGITVRQCERWLAKTRKAPRQPRTK